jgi:glycosyltransferase involved in cell wall biosynthesis
MSAIKLSICIATYKRGNYIGQTLDSIVSQLRDGVEVVILDGASPDNTEQVVRSYTNIYPAIRYIRASKNSGVDFDYDLAVNYATGEYCWLMTDDDLLKNNAIDIVLQAIEDNTDLLVVNSEVKNSNLNCILDERLIKIEKDIIYKKGNSEIFFINNGQALSFIGCVIIKKSIWMERNRDVYYGTLFIHVGVIFQKLLKGDIRVIAEPLITIRYGNAMWAPRGFEIWMFKWPELIWSFNCYSEYARQKVCSKEPWRNIKYLLRYRATGGYSVELYRKFIKQKPDVKSRILYLLISLMPEAILNTLLSVHCLVFDRGAKSRLYSLGKSKCTTKLTRWIAAYLGVKFE